MNPNTTHATGLAKNTLTVDGVHATTNSHAA
jgi:hypothetical protein